MIYTNSIVKLLSINKENNINTENSKSTAFFISKNYLITCYHCINDSIKNYIVFDGNNTKYEVDVIKTIYKYDIALLQIINSNEIDFNYDYLELSFQKLNLGDEIIVAGYPNLSEHIKLSNGIISGYENLDYQISAPINPGNSGGPLLFNNKVIGIVSYKLLDTEGMGFCKAFVYMKNWINYILNDKNNQINIRIPELKMNFCNGHKKLFDFYKYKNVSGIIITESFEHFLKKGDIIISVNNFKVDNNSYILQLKMFLLDYISTQLFNQKVIFRIIRNKNIIIVENIFKENQKKCIDIKLYKEEFENIKYKSLTFTKLTTNHIDEILQSEIDNISNQKFDIIQYMHKYSKKEIWFISNISSNIDKDIMHSIHLYDIVIKLNDFIIFKKDDLLNSIKNNLEYPYLLTKSKNIIFL